MGRCDRPSRRCLLPRARDRRGGGRAPHDTAALTRPARTCVRCAYVGSHGGGLLGSAAGNPRAALDHSPGHRFRDLLRRSRYSRRVLLLASRPALVTVRPQSSTHRGLNGIADVRKTHISEPVSNEEALSATRTLTSARWQPISQTAAFWTLSPMSGRFQARRPAESAPLTPPCGADEQTSTHTSTKRQPEGQSCGRTPHFCCRVDRPRRTQVNHPAPAQPSRMTLRSRSRRRWRPVRDHPVSAFRYPGWSRTTGAKQPETEESGSGSGSGSGKHKQLEGDQVPKQTEQR